MIIRYFRNRRIRKEIEYYISKIEEYLHQVEIYDFFNDNKKVTYGREEAIQSFCKSLRESLPYSQYKIEKQDLDRVRYIFDKINELKEKLK